MALGECHLAQRGSPSLDLAATTLAREEYAHAHAIFTSLLQVQPNDFEVSRQKAAEKATLGQRFRPMPLTMTAADARAAMLGI